MEDWEALASSIGYTSETEMWLDLYIGQSKSITELSKMLGYGQATIWRRLEQNGIPKRGRGGANNAGKILNLLRLWDQREVLKGPLTQVASFLRIHVSMLYKFRRRVKE